MRATLPDPAAPPAGAGDWARAMRDGDFARALACNDAVLAARHQARAVPDDPSLPYHLRWVWDGTPPDGRDVLVRCYHGLGDTLQFARYLPALFARARSVTLEAPAALASLLDGLLTGPGTLDTPGTPGTPGRVVPFRANAPLPPPPAASGCAVEIMELGHALRLPPPPPLSPAVPPARVAAARRRLAGPGPLVGLCWQAGDWDPARSVPFAALQPLLDVPGLRLVSLQRGLAGLQADSRFENPGDLCTGMTETAALLLALDLVVTVDTAVAHLAGALAVPTLVLLRAEADWRWMRGERSAWYPHSLLLRQASEGDWGPVLEAAARHLRRLAAGEV